MKIFRPFIFLTLLYFSFNTANSQQFSYRHYGIRDGLAGNYVYHGIQDRNGFLWFATETGVSRFDGTRFKNFSSADGLPDNEVLKLIEDSKGRIWMLPFQNEICFYQDGVIHNAANDSLIKKLNIRERVLNVFEDANHNLIFMDLRTMRILTPQGKILYNKDEFMRTHTYFLSGGIDANQKPHAFLYNTGKGGVSNLWEIRIEEDYFTFIPYITIFQFWGNKINHCPINKYRTVFLDNLKRNRFKTDAFIFYDPRYHKIDTFNLDVDVNDLSFINDSILYLSTVKGSLKYNFKTKKAGYSFLQEENISFTFKDNEDNIWFTTLGNGIYRLYSDAIMNIPMPGNLLHPKPVESILISDTSIICGSTNDIIYLVNRKNLTITERAVNGLRQSSRIFSLKKFRDSIYCAGDLFFGKTDMNINGFAEMTFGNMGLAFKDFEIDEKGYIYFSTHIATLVTKFGEKVDPFLILSQRSTSLALTDSGVYAGTINGLYFIGNDCKEDTIYLRFPELKGRITKIIKADNCIWVGTNGNGIFCYDGQKIIAHISEKDGLVGNLIRVMVLNDQVLWVGTDRGISRINILTPNTFDIQNFSIIDGLLYNIINAIAIEGDLVFIGTSKGLTILNEKQIKSSAQCLLRLMSVTVSDKQRAGVSGLSLEPSENNIRFDFVAISFKAEGNNTYYYKLEGIDKDWNKTNQTFLSYPTLPAGDYKLNIYAVNKFGVKSETLNFEFHVNQYWYKKTASLIIGGLLIAVLLWLIVKIRINRIKRNQQAKTETAERMAMLEQQALKAQMNPHFIFNCLNSIQQYVIEKDVEGANRFITGFAALIRQTLDNSGKAYITVAEEENFLRTYLELEKSRFEDKFDYGITIAPEIRKDLVSMPPLLLQPYVENCIRHGIMHKKTGIGMVTIRFGILEDYLVCEVIDNGIGREKAAEYKRSSFVTHESKGTSLTGQRINLMNKKSQSDILLDISDIFDKDGNIAGTKVTVRVPLLPLD